MRKVCTLSAVVCFLSPLLSAATPPVDRLEGESVSEDGTGLFGPNSYIDGDDPFAPPSLGDSDLGEQVILRRQQSRSTVLRAQADAFLFWSNNVGSVESNEEEGWITGGSVSARLKRQLRPNLFFDAYAYQDAYFYDKNNLDFQSTEFGAGLIAKVPWVEGLTVYGRYEFLYVHSDNPFVTFLNPKDEVDSRYHRLRIGGHKAIFSKPRHLVALSSNGRWDFDASSGAARRRQLSGRLSYTWTANDRLQFTGYYRLSYRDYLSSGREDWNNYFGIEAKYSINDWAQLYGSVIYGTNESNVAGRDYEALQGGLGFGLRASF